LNGIIDQLFNLIIDRSSREPLPELYVSFLVVLNLIVIIVAVFICYRLFRAWKTAKALKNQISPIFYLSLAFLFEVFILFLDNIIKSSTQSQFRLNLTIQILPFFLIIIASKSIIQTLVRVPKFRHFRML